MTSLAVFGRFPRAQAILDTTIRERAVHAANSAFKNQAFRRFAWGGMERHFEATAYQLGTAYNPFSPPFPFSLGFLCHFHGYLASVWLLFCFLMSGLSDLTTASSVDSLSSFSQPHRDCVLGRAYLICIYSWDRSRNTGGLFFIFPFLFHKKEAAMRNPARLRPRQKSIFLGWIRGAVFFYIISPPFWIVAFHKETG